MWYHVNWFADLLSLCDFLNKTATDPSDIIFLDKINTGYCLLHVVWEKENGERT